MSAAVGGFPPVAALLLYTFLTTGSPVHPGYDYQYQLEANGYPTLGYHPEWSVEDARYIPQNIGIMFGALPSRGAGDHAGHAGLLRTPSPLCTEPGRRAVPVRH